MGRLFVVSLEGSICIAKLIWASLMTSSLRLSTVDMGKLIYSISVNVTVGEKEERMMITGMHTVVDIFCVGCGSIVGWKYESAHEKIQKYKEGKFILERFKVLGPDGSMYMLGQEVQVDGSDADDV